MWRYLLSALAIVGGGTAIVIGGSAVLGSFDDPGTRRADPTAPRIAEAQERLDALRAQTAQQQRELEGVQLRLAQMKLEEDRKLALQESELARLALAKAAEMAPPPAPPTPAKPRATSRPTMSDREVLLGRLRKRFVNADDLPNAEPPSPPRQRLLDARAAVMQGRVTDAERFLQEAHTQLTFQPVTPDQTTPRPAPSAASRRIAQALTDLSSGDMQHALQNIDLATQSIN